jgi:hypothetical protein
MKKRVHIYHRIVTLFVCTWLLLSCIAEDFSYCFKEVRVYFTFLDETVDRDDVRQMHLYLFNQDGTFAGEYRDDHIGHLDKDYYIRIMGLSPGNYRLVAWGGKDERCYATSPVTFVIGQTTYDEARLMLEHTGNIISTPVQSLFHSEMVAIVVIDQPVQRFEMPLAQLTNTINVRTVGLPTDSNTYTFHITDNNCTYTFNRSFASHSHEPFTFRTDCIKDRENQLQASLRVLRLSENRRIPQLQIYNQTTGTALYPFGTYSGDLIGLILAAYPQNNFETTHTYDIVLTFSGDESTGFSVSVTINGWQVQDNSGILSN